jgi:hypothetical protein
MDGKQLKDSDLFQVQLGTRFGMHPTVPEPRYTAFSEAEAYRYIADELPHCQWQLIRLPNGVKGYPVELYDYCRFE